MLKALKGLLILGGMVGLFFYAFRWADGKPLPQIVAMSAVLYGLGGLGCGILLPSWWTLALSAPGLLLYSTAALVGISFYGYSGALAPVIFIVPWLANAAGLYAAILWWRKVAREDPA